MSNSNYKQDFAFLFQHSFNKRDTKSSEALLETSILLKNKKI